MSATNELPRILADIDARLTALEQAGPPASPTSESFQVNYLTVRPDGTVNPLIQFGGGAGGDLTGTYPNPQVATVRGGLAPLAAGDAAGGALSGTYPSPGLNPVPADNTIGSPMTLYGTALSALPGATSELVMVGTSYAVLFDPDGCDGGGVYTCPRAGFYLVTGAVFIVSAGGGAVDLDLALENRSSGVGLSSEVIADASTRSYQVTAILPASAGDQLGFEAQAGGATVNILGNGSVHGHPAVFFSVVEVGSG